MAYTFKSITQINTTDTISENLNLLAEQDGKTVRLNSTVIPKLDDTKVSKNETWSSRKIINSLCPTLEEKEPIIKCLPLAESPLEVTSYIEPKQEGTGTPSPDNIRPISGSNTISLTRRKKNLFNAERVGKIENWDVSKTYGYIDLNIPVGKYILSYSPQVTSLNGHIALICKKPATSSDPLTSIINGSGGVSAKSTIFEVLDGERIYLNWYVSSVAGAKNQTALNDFMNSVLINAQIEQGEAQTDYEPYQGNTYMADLNETVYGGSYNWTTGTLTKDCGIITIDRNASVQARSYGFIVHIPDMEREKNANESEVIKAVNNMKTTIFNKVYVKEEQYIISAGTDFNGVAFYTNDEHLNNIDAIAAWLADNPITIVYRKIQQTTTQFESRNIKAINGENFIYSDCGETKVKYDADIKKYVDMAIEEATKEEEWELIENIALSEDTNVLIRTQYTDGTPFNLSAAKVRIWVYYPITKSIGTRVDFKSKNTLLGFLVTSLNPHDTGSTAHKTTALYQAKPVAGTYEFIGAMGTQGSPLSMFYPSNGDYQTTPTTNKINEIKIESWQNVFPAGTTIEIWGVRA